MGAWSEEIAGEAAFADAGAGGGKEGEERVRPGDVEVMLVEVVSRAEGVFAGAGGVKRLAFGAFEGGNVKTDEALCGGDG